MSWHVGTLAAGSKAEMKLVARVVGMGSIVNTVAASVQSFDPTGQRKMASASVLATAPVTVPTTHTGEPWSGWDYWLLLILLAIAGLAALALTRRRAVA